MEKGDKVLVTGATGFVGSRVIRLLLEEGWKVRGLTRSSSKAKKLEEKGCEAIVGDVRNPQVLEKAVEGVGAVIHLVAILVPGRGFTYEDITHQGTVNMIKAAQKANAPRFIYVSALGVKSGDNNPYILAKWQAEEAVRNSGLDYTIFRPCYMYGAGGSFLQLLVNLTRLPLISVVGSGKQKLQMLYVEDTAACLVKALQKEETIGKVYELGGAYPLTYDEVLDEIAKARGKSPRLKIHLPFGLIRPLARLGAVLIPSFPATPDNLELILRDSVCDITPAEQTFGIKMTPFPEGLKKSLV